MQQVYGNDLRLALVNEVNTYYKFLGGKPFFGGEELNLVDIHLFGVLRSVADEETGRYILQNTPIGPWYRRVYSALYDDNQLGAP